jgi:hypothetical protein
MTKRRIYILPWVAFDECFDFGSYRFERFGSGADLEILTDIENTNLNFLVHRFLDPKKGEGAFLTVAYNTASLTDDPHNFQHCVDALAYLCMTYGGISPDLADQFTFFNHELEPSAPINQTRVQWGGRIAVALGTDDFVYPPYYLVVKRPLVSVERSRLFNEFNVALQATERNTSLFHSLRWYNLAHTKAAYSTKFVQLVFLCTGFETLFQLPFRGKKKEFQNELSTVFSCTGVDIERLRRWAALFYELRSDIVHKQIVSNLSFEDVGVNSHFEIGDRAYTLCVTSKMDGDLTNPIYDAHLSNLNYSMWSDRGRCERFLELSTNEKLEDPDTISVIRKYAMRLVGPNPADEDREILSRTLKRVQKLRGKFPLFREFDAGEEWLKAKLSRLN